MGSKAPTIAAIGNAYGDSFIRAYIMGWIVNLREFINVSNAMTDEQTRMTAAMIVTEYQNLNIADINLIFRNAKLGRYGQFYGRLDGQMILGWFDKYFEERCIAASELSISRANQARGSDRYESPERLRKLIGSVLAPKTNKGYRRK